MRLLGSLVFLIGALFLGVIAYFPLGNTHYLQLARIFLAPASDTQDGVTTQPDAPATMQGRNFSPGPRLLQSRSTAGAPAGQREDKSEVVTLDKPASPPPSSAMHKSEEATSASAASNEFAPGPHPHDTWRTVVVANNNQAHRAAPKRDDYHARYELARSLQTELARVGCYSGNVDGDWGPGSRRAASAFLRKVNATLPIDTPDHILLTLIQGHADKACGVDCPRGQGLASDGRCLPNVIMARGPNAGKLLARQTFGERQMKYTGEIAPAAVAAAAPVLPSGHSAIRTAQPGAATGTSAARASPDVAGAISAGASARSEHAALQRAEDAATRLGELPGMMAVGAPKPERDSTQTPPVTTTLAPPPVSVQAGPHRENQPPRQPRTARARDTDIGIANGSSSRSREKPSPSPAVERPQREVYAPPRTHKSTEHRDIRNRNHDMVRTFSGRVRRGSPQHNLMLSLGGVF